MALLSSPGKYSGTLTSSLGLVNEHAAKQVQALTLSFTQETLTIVENLGLSEDERKSVATIIATIKCYIEGYINESVERRNFRCRIQQPGEPSMIFLSHYETCNFCLETCTQKNIRDQIIAGLSDGDSGSALAGK